MPNEDRNDQNDNKNTPTPKPASTETEELIEELTEELIEKLTEGFDKKVAQSGKPKKREKDLAEIAKQLGLLGDDGKPESAPKKQKPLDISTPESRSYKNIK